MRDVIDFIAQCAQSGTLLTSLCAIVLLPSAAWLACRFVAPQIVRMSDDPAWQAPLAAVAAGLPSALLVALSIAAVFNGISSACLVVPTGRVVFGLIIGVMTAAFMRAMWLTAARALDIRRLVRRSSEPSRRLSEIARSSGLQVREVTDAAPICVLAGVSSPVVLVSTGALAALSDDELRAALHHERAHARRGDQHLAAALSFLTDLLPLPADDLVQTYRLARELAADGAAATTVRSEDLAGALLQFTKAGRALAGVSSLMGDRSSTVTKRLRALLGRTDSTHAANLTRRVAITLALLAIGSLGIMAPVLAGQHSTSCTQIMKASR